MGCTGGARGDTQVLEGFVPSSNFLPGEASHVSLCDAFDRPSRTGTVTAWLYQIKGFIGWRSEARRIVCSYAPFGALFVLRPLQTFPHPTLLSPALDGLKAPQLHHPRMILILMRTLHVQAAVRSHLLDSLGPKQHQSIHAMPSIGAMPDSSTRLYKAK